MALKNSPYLVALFSLAVNVHFVFGWGLGIRRRLSLSHAGGEIGVFELRDLRRSENEKVLLLDLSWKNQGLA